jgi:hypothetical protein
LLGSYSFAYWGNYDGDPRDFDPRQPLHATAIDLPLNVQVKRREIRKKLRELAFKVLNDVDDDAVNVLLVLIYAENTGKKDRLNFARQLEWMAKLLGKDGKEIDEFTGRECFLRFQKGNEDIQQKEEYVLVKSFLEQRASDLSVYRSPHSILSFSTIADAPPPSLTSSPDQQTVVSEISTGKQKKKNKRKKKEYKELDIMSASGFDVDQSDPRR